MSSPTANGKERVYETSNHFPAAITRRIGEDRRSIKLEQ
jgi:hypothetical protein